MEKIFLLVQSMLAMAAAQFKSKDSKEGIKETKEALIGVNEVALFMAEKLKDGVQVSDATDFYSKLTSDEAFKSKVKAAYDNYQAIPKEIQDVDAGEGMELAACQLDYAPKILAALSKKDA